MLQLISGLILIVGIIGYIQHQKAAKQKLEEQAKPHPIKNENFKLGERVRIKDGTTGTLEAYVDDKIRLLTDDQSEMLITAEEIAEIL